MQSSTLLGPDHPLALADPDLLAHLVGDPDRVRDDEIGRGVVAQEQGRPRAADKLRRDLEDRIKEILREPSRARGLYIHRFPHAPLRQSVR